MSCKHMLDQNVSFKQLSELQTLSSISGITERLGNLPSITQLALNLPSICVFPHLLLDASLVLWAWIPQKEACTLLPPTWVLELLWAMASHPLHHLEELESSTCDFASCRPVTSACCSSPQHILHLHPREPGTWASRSGKTLSGTLRALSLSMCQLRPDTQGHRVLSPVPLVIPCHGDRDIPVHAMRDIKPALSWLDVLDVDMWVHACLSVSYRLVPLTPHRGLHQMWRIPGVSSPSSKLASFTGISRGIFTIHYPSALRLVSSSKSRTQPGSLPGRIK